MSLQRKCNSLTLILIVVMAIILGFGYLSLQESYVHATQKEHEIVKRREHENILQEQLKVVYRHTSRVEEELKKEREKHKKTLLELLDRKSQFLKNVTKTKHEAWTRFHALDSDYKMLKADHEEMKSNYMSLQAQYRRLSSDHHRLTKESRESYEELKNSKESESLSLQDRIQELYKKNVYYFQLAEQNEDYYMKMKEYFESCQKVTNEYKGRLAEYHKLLEDAQKKNEIEKKVVVNDTSINIKLEKLETAQKNLTKQKSISKDQLKEKNGVKGIDVDHMKNMTTNEKVIITATPASASNVNKKNDSLSSNIDKKPSDQETGHGRYGNIAQEPEEQANQKHVSPSRSHEVKNSEKHEENKPVVGQQDVLDENNANQLKPPDDKSEENEHIPDNRYPAGNNQLAPPDSSNESNGVDDNHSNTNSNVKEKSENNHRGKESNKLPLMRPVQGMDHKQKERLNVNKVTLEEDENGDQNLDGEEPEKEMGMNGNNIGEDKQENEEKLHEDDINNN